MGQPDTLVCVEPAKTDRQTQLNLPKEQEKVVDFVLLIT